ncbi:MAG: LysM peptidoglycan-binding domain-containing protein [Candidatus Moduliflexus flocculans]|nr:LysM peptidoglycan-binding domain-containing protein [Candidatus Moduliflexus flocculans]
MAQRFYGKASLYPKIFEANRDILSNPDLIKVGQKLKIPKV